MIKSEETVVKKPRIEADSGFSLRDLLNILFCHKWKIILFFLTVTSTVTIVTYRMPHFFASEATLLVGVGRDPTSIAPKILGPGQYLSLNQIERVNNELTIMTSRELARRVVKQMGVDDFFPRLREAKRNRENLPEENRVKKPESKEARAWRHRLKEIAANQVIHGLSVEVKPKSFIINLSMLNRDAELANRILKELIKTYINRHLELQKAEKSVDVFQQRYERFEIELEERENTLAGFKRKHGIASMGSQKQMLISRMDGFPLCLPISRPRTDFCRIKYNL